MNPLSRLKNQIANMVARAVVNLIDDSKKVQLMQLDVLADETVEELERLQNYGFTSVPKKGAEAVVLFVAGHRDHGLVVTVDDRRYRIGNLADGEVCVYDSTGSKIHLKSNGDIEVTPSSGTLKVNGAVSATGEVTANANTTPIHLSSHKHVVAGGNTGGSVVFTPTAGQTGGPV